MTGRGAVRRRAHGRALLWLVFANVALMLADATGYLSAAGPAGALGWAFVAVAMVAQIATANLLVVLPLLVVSQLGAGSSSWRPSPRSAWPSASPTRSATSPTPRT